MPDTTTPSFWGAWLMARAAALPRSRFNVWRFPPDPGIHINLGRLRIRIGRYAWRTLSERYPEHFPNSERWRYLFGERLAWSVR